MLFLPTCLTLGAFAAPSDSDHLLQYVPADSAGVVLVGDLASRMAEEDKTGWLAVLADPRLSALVAEFAELDGTDDDFAFVGELTGAAIGLDSDGVTMTLVLEGTDELVPSIQAAVESAGGTFEERDVAGGDGFVITDGDEDDSEATLFRSHDGLWLGVNSYSAEDAELELFGMLMDEFEGGPALVENTERTDGAVFEFFVDFSAIDDADLEEIADVVEGVYAAVAVGDGHAGTLDFAFLWAQPDLVAPFAEAFQEPDLELLAIAPADAVAVTTAEIDVLTLIDALIAVMPEEAAEQFEAGMEAGSATIGVDIEGELIAALDGSFVQVQWESDVEGLMDEDPAATLDSLGVLAVQILDSEPFYVLMETAEGFIGPDDLSSEDEGDATVWTLVVEEGVEIVLRLSDDWLMIGSAEHVAAIAEREAMSEFDGFVSKSVRDEVASRGSGFYQGVFDAGRALTMFDELFAYMADFDEDLDDLDLEILGAFSELITIATDHVEGMALGTFDLTAERGVLRAEML